jgi:hypothetical protein
MSLDPLIFVTGCVGAAAPELVRIYNAKSQNLTVSWKSALISIGFFLFGGFLATVVLSASNYYAAFYDGAAAPIIISNVAGTAPATPPPPHKAEALGRLQRETISFQTHAAPLSAREYLAVLTGSTKSYETKPAERQ